jgi:hypothetical protein
VLFICGCAARQPGSAQEVRAPEGEKEVSITALDKDILGVDTVANVKCNNVNLAIKQQQLWLKKKTVREKNVALLITTVIGAGGLVATTILANNQTIDTTTMPQTANTTPTTVTGTITAGATALGGVLAAFVVGGGNDDEAKLYDEYADQVTAKQKELSGVCSNGGAPVVPPAPAAQSGACADKAAEVKTFCNDVAGKLRWKVVAEK